MTNLLLKIALRFLPWESEKLAVASPLDFAKVRIFKTLFGRRYLVRVIELPPEPLNCRCVVVKPRVLDERGLPQAWWSDEFQSKLEKHPRLQKPDA